jgi:UDP-N-acetylmuramoyl-L-alanyl-D-glutamate--2,6-diaminopimelate ligase
VANLDDAYGRRLAGEAPIPMVTFSAAGAADADWRAVDVQLGPAGSVFRVVGPDGASADAAVPLPGPFNVANALGAITALVTAGIPLAAAVAGVASSPGVPGRLERVDAGQPYVAVVDYAHKPDALKAVLESLREVTKGRLHVVVGCGGDRDPFKRGPMGAIAARIADTAVLTSDNPRSEDPLAILATMLAGAAEVPEAERGEVLVVPDRADAIRQAVARAHAGDTVLVAGKGHEVGQYAKGEVRPFDDREVLREAVAQTAQTTRPESAAAADERATRPESAVSGDERANNEGAQP